MEKYGYTMSTATGSKPSLLFYALQILQSQRVSLQRSSPPFIQYQMRINVTS